jgi:TetR/AcrR family transcriptional repressor of nem operon
VGNARRPLLYRGADAGVIPQDASPEKLARVFWSGWEGAVMRAKLFQSAEPLNQYWEFFLHSITQK